jgi:glycosyltransferase involved in cell wall biosynthesis
MVRNILYIPRTSNLAGSERQLALIIQGLDRTKYRPLVLCPGNGSLVDLLLESGEQVMIDTPLAGTRKITFPLTRLPGVLKRNDIALLHLNATRFCSIGAAIAGVPVVEAITMSRAIPESFASRHPAVDRFFSRFPKLLMVPSRFQARELTARGIPEEKMVVLYNAVWPSLQRWATAPDREGVRRDLGIPRESLLIGVFGRLEPQKGIADFLDAAAHLAPKNPNVFFLVCGDGSLKESLLSQRRELGLSNRVLMPGFQPEIFRWLTALDISVSSSHWEPLSNHVIESMHAGLPIVATDVGGTSEAVIDQETGLLVPPHAPEAMAAAIQRLLDDDQLRKRLGEHARAKAQAEFGADQMAETIDSAYDRILGA